MNLWWGVFCGECVLFGLDAYSGLARLRGISGLLVVLIVAAFLAQASQPVSRWLLEQEARQSSANWAAHIFDEIVEGEEAALAGHTPEAYLDLASALEAALRAGFVNQVTIRNLTCGCTVTTDAMSLADGKDDLVRQLKAFLPGDAQDHGHRSPPSSEPAHFKPDPKLLPPEVRLITGTGPGEPDYGAEVTFSRQIGDEAYQLGLTIDVTMAMARIRLMTLMGALILTLMLTGAGLFVIRAALRSRRAIHLSERQARFLAEHDTLTGLLNRFGFGARAEVLLQKCADARARAILFQVDADKFKDINDIYGHATGDRVIHAIAKMLRGAFPEAALVTRLGGDEFAVLVTEAALSGPPERFVTTLPTSTDVKSDDGASLISVSISIGFAVYPDDAKSADGLMKAADLALYAVKDAGRNAVGAYHRDMTKALERRHWELQGIREAIRQGQLIPHYQPLVSARTGKVEGVEALARWHHPTYGVIGPNRFQHALSDRGVSTEITEAMLTRIAGDLRVWRNLGYRFSAAMNIGEADLKDPDLTQRIANVLAESDLPPEALAIEVTETALTAANTASAGPLLKRYRDAGGFVALDDFGTGNSSITLLKNIPYSSVKIDRSFIRDLTVNETDLAIVRSIVRMSREIGFKIVAEGIETREQVQLLRKLRVDLLQGYLFSKPLPARELTELLDKASPPWVSPPRRKPEADAA